MEDWKELIDKIQSASDEIEVPEELRPEAIEEMLKKHVSDQPEKKAKPNYKRISRTWGGLAAAAMVAIVVMTGVSKLGLGMDKAADMEAAAPMMEEACIEDVATEEAAEEETEEIANEPIATAGSYEEIYEKLADYEAIIFEEYRGMVSEGGMIMEDAAEEKAEAPSAPMEEPAASAQDSNALQSNGAIAEKEDDYSVTNTREEAVDEADIVKTDGRYIYTCSPSNAEVKIIRAEDLELCEIIRLEDVAVISEIYVENERLTILGTRAVTALAEDEDGLYYSDYKTESVVRVYDISDPENPEEIGTVSQEGTYYSSRKVGDYLYLFTNCRKEKKSVKNVDSYIPEVNGALLSSDKIYLPSDQVTGRYLLISSVNLNSPEEIVDAKGILCDSSQMYISHQNIYLMQDRYDMDVNQTEIFKFWFYHGMIFSRAVGLVEGRIQDSFCIDEHNGDLRVVTTAWTGGGQKSSLYVMDSELQIIGSLENVAPGEDVRSARLMGDIGYFVTFRQVDPLFCVDLSNPTEPKILGELKVSGFSSYLHPYGDGRMLGMGEEADVSSGRFEGYKISMFDVSEPGQMKELDKVVFKDVSMLGLHNYKTVFVQPAKNLIGVCLEEWKAGNASVRYQVYRYEEENGFVRVLDHKLVLNDTMVYYNLNFIRALYIGDTLYIVSPKEITAFDMNNGFAITGNLLF